MNSAAPLIVHIAHNITHNMHLHCCITFVFYIAETLDVCVLMQVRHTYLIAHHNIFMELFGGRCTHFQSHSAYAHTNTEYYTVFVLHLFCRRIYSAATFHTNTGIYMVAHKMGCL